MSINNYIAQGFNVGEGAVKAQEIKNQRNFLKQKQAQQWAMQGLELAKELPGEARMGWIQQWYRLTPPEFRDHLPEPTAELGEILAQFPEPQAGLSDKNVVLSPGAGMYNSKGELIAQQPFKPDPPKKPGAPVKVIDDKNQVKFVSPEDAMNPRFRPYTKETYEAALEDAKQTDPRETKKALRNLAFLNTTLKQAKDVSSASGRSGARRFVEGAVVGATDYTKLENKVNTLRTNVLTLSTDPAIKKFFGPQMSEADVKLMSAGGTTLDPESQDEEDMMAELVRLEDLFGRMVQSIAVDGLGYSPEGVYAITPQGEVVEIVD